MIWNIALAIVLAAVVLWLLQVLVVVGLGVIVGILKSLE